MIEHAGDLVALLLFVAFLLAWPYMVEAARRGRRHRAAREGKR